MIAVAEDRFRICKSFLQYPDVHFRTYMCPKLFNFEHKLSLFSRELIYIYSCGAQLLNGAKLAIRFLK